MKPSVQVLLSTYNGEKYLGEQIDSILAQEEVSVALLIRDDGSSDGTCNIIESYNNRQITFMRGKNVGATKSFFELIRVAGESEYYAFSDQDDVWDSDKLISAINRIGNESNRPIVYGCNTRLVDADLNIVKIEDKIPDTNLGSALVSNYVAGCTQVYNRATMELLKIKTPKYAPFHDWWVNLAVLSVDGISIFDSTPHISYRQHGNNVVGASNYFMGRWKKRFYKFFKKPYHRDLIADELLQIYGRRITHNNIILLKTLAGYRQNKFAVIFNRSFHTSRRLDKVLFLICILFGKV